MRLLGKPVGIYSLKDSDNNIGSFIKKEDACSILGVKENSLSNLKFRLIDGLQVIDELILQKSWYAGLIPEACPTRVNKTKVSLDEFILIQLIKRVYADAVISHQVSCGRKKIDLKVELNGITKYIEFHGPYHFIFTQYGNPENPLIRNLQIEKELENECVIWPYWIPKCESNVKAIFENDFGGKGAIWSANVHFSQFVFENSADIIEKITGRFTKNADYGSFYRKGNNGVNKPEHPKVFLIKQSGYHKNL
jgi:hypothetical protein